MPAAVMHAVKIEGIGNASAATTDGLYRWCYAAEWLTDSAAADPDGLYKTGLLQWPNELGSSVDFRTGGASSSTNKYKIRADSAGGVWLDLMRFTHTEQAALIGDLLSTDTSIKVDTAGLDGTYFLSRECIVIDGATQATITGGYSYDVTRHKLGTTARKHTAGALDDKYLYSTCTVLAGRLVQLVRVAHSSSTAYDETTIWSGVLRNLTTPDSGLSIEVQADSLLQLVQRQQILRDRFEGRCWIASDRAVEPLQIFHVGPNVAPAGGAGLTSGRKALFRVGDHLVEGDYSELIARDGSNFQLTINVSPAAVFAGLPLPEDLTQLAGAPIREVFSTRDDAPSNAITATDQTLPLSAHPGKLVLQLLTTTKNGNSAGSNGDYDLGCDVLAGGITADLIDTAAVLAWGDQIGVQISDLYIGLENQPLTLGAFFQDLLTPMMSAMVQSTAGLLTIIRLEDLAPYNTGSTVTAAQVLDVGIAHDVSLQDAIDQAGIEYNALPGITPAKVTARDAVNYRRQPPGFANSLDLRAHGLADLDVVTLLCQALIARYHEPIPIITITTAATVNLDLGAVVKVTNEKIFGAEGVRGVTALNVLIVGRQESFSDTEHTIRYQCLMVGLIHPRDSYIAPSATVASIVDTTNFIVSSNVFTTSTSTADDPFTTDVEGFDKLDNIEFVDQYGTPTGATNIEIASVSGNQITTSTVPSPAPVVGDIIRPARYQNCVASQQADWVFVANSSNQLGAADLPKTYRS